MKNFLSGWAARFGLVAGLLLAVNAFAAGSYTLPYNSTTFWTVNYGGGQNCTSGCSATVKFTPSGWSTTAGVTTFDLTLLVSNTSSAPVISSVLTGLGFNTSPNPYVAETKKTPASGDQNYSVTILDLGAVGLADDPFRQRLLLDHMPQVGDVDFCVIAKSSGGNCAGAGSGNEGVASGTSATGKIRITYSGTGSFTFDNFYARYQAIMPGDGSDVGTGCIGDCIPQQTIPEPSFYLLLSGGLGALIFARHRRNRKTAE
jgi:hypothetical protein